MNKVRRWMWALLAVATLVAPVSAQERVPTCREANELLAAVLVEQVRLRSLSTEDIIVNTISSFEYRGLEVLKQQIGEFRVRSCPEA